MIHSSIILAVILGGEALGFCQMGRRETHILWEIFMGQEPGRYNPPPLIGIRPRIPKPTSFRPILRYRNEFTHSHNNQGRHTKHDNSTEIFKTNE
ncbi:hypothetical protein YC2023_031780 [Brassica napus]